MDSPKLLCAGKHLNFVSRQGWEYVERPGISGIVAIVATTDDRRIVLVEQMRLPFGKEVIELPAGLAGDGGRQEDLLTAARRELLEETGYECAHARLLGAGAASAGLSTEIITFVGATGLSRKTEGGGVDGESIRTRLILIDEIETWLTEQSHAGKLLDLKIYAGLYFDARK